VLLVFLPYNPHEVKLLNDFIGGLHIPVQVWDAAGEVLLTNARFNQLLGFPSDLDWRSHGLRLAEDAQLQDETLQDCFRRAFSGVAVELHGIKYVTGRSEHSVHDTSGDLVISLMLRPLPADNSTPQCIVAVVSDFSGSGERYDEGLIRGQKMENIEILASGVAHEFNNIFTGIKGMTDLIKYEVDRKSEIYEFAQSIEETIARGAQLIQKLSVFARDMPYALRRQSLSGYLRNAVPLLELQVRRRVQISVEQIDDGEVFCDAHRLDQALGHIAVNARDAMGGQGRIHLTTVLRNPEAIRGQPQADRAEWIMLELADSGPGIAAEIRHRVLEPFFSTKERGKSTGLGLTVAHRIITAMNGIMEIGHSDTLGGAAFRIYLPLAGEQSKQNNPSDVSVKSSVPAA
jgi:signal transduction histidine kinase